MKIEPFLIERVRADFERASPLPFSLGDAYNQCGLPYGAKFATVTDILGAAMAKKAQKWAVVSAAFSGDRAALRDCAPFWFLQEIASLDSGTQDALLAEYRQQPMNQKHLRNRIKRERTGQ